MSTIQPETRKRIPGILDMLGIPFAVDDPALSKAEYIESRLSLVVGQDLISAVEKFLARHGGELRPPTRFELEELLWSVTPKISIPKRTRYEVARALEGRSLYIKPTPFLDLVRRLWERTTLTTLKLDTLFGDANGSFMREVERHSSAILTTGRSSTSSNISVLSMLRTSALRVSSKASPRPMFDPMRRASVSSWPV